MIISALSAPRVLGADDSTSDDHDQLQHRDYCNGASTQETRATSGWYVTWENDIAGAIQSDDFYTQGAQVGFTLKNKESLGFMGRLTSPLCKWMGFDIADHDGMKAIGARTLFFGQQLYTPQDTFATEAVPHDRPYAGWLYVGSRLELVRPLPLDSDGFRNWSTHSFESQIGVVGQSALGKQTQRAFHHNVTSGHANGWNNQITDRVGLQALYHYSRRLMAANWFASSDGHNGGIMVDAIGQGTAQIGTLQTYGELGMTLRLGRNMGPLNQRAVIPTVFTADMPMPVPGIKESLANDLPHSNDTERCSLFTHPQECYVFVGATARGVKKNIFLEPAASGAGRDIEPKSIVYEFSVGARARYSTTRIDLLSTIRSREFSPMGGQPLLHNGWHDFTSVTITCYGRNGRYNGDFEWTCPGFVAGLVGFLVIRD